MIPTRELDCFKSLIRTDKEVEIGAEAGPTWAVQSRPVLVAGMSEEFQALPWEQLLVKIHSASLTWLKIDLGFDYYITVESESSLHVQEKG